MDGIKIPYHIKVDIQKLKKNSEKEEIENTLTVPEISKKIGISKNEARNVMIALSAQNPLSLNQEINDGEATLIDMIGKSEEREDNLWIAYAMLKLNKREQEIIKSRYILNTPLTFDIIGKKLNLTRQRVHQLESKALRKIGAYYNKMKK